LEVEAAVLVGVDLEEVDVLGAGTEIGGGAGLGEGVGGVRRLSGCGDDRKST